MGPSQISYFVYYVGTPSDQFYRLLYWGPQISFSLTIWGPFRLVSALTIWGPLRSVYVHTMWWPLQISFFVFYLGASLQITFFSYYMAPPQISFFAYIYYMESPQISSFAKYMRVPSDQFFRLLYGSPFKLVSLLTIWGPSDLFLRILYGGHSKIIFFAYYMEPHSDQFLCML